MGTKKRMKEIDLDLSGIPNLEDGVEQKSQVPSRKSILQERENADKGQGMFVTIGTSTFKRLGAYIVMNSGSGSGRLTKSSITEAALNAYLDKLEGK